MLVYKTDMVPPLMKHTGLLKQLGKLHTKSFHFSESECHHSSYLKGLLCE